jgi:Fic family protein
MELLTHNTIEETYQFLDYDYEEELLYKRAAKELTVGQLDLNRQMPEHGSRRQSFLGRFDWCGDKLPSHEHILRLFNQVNTFYAERWAMSHLTAEPQSFLKECGRLILHRQGKQSGFRIKNISFGIRKDIDFLDPFRQFKILRGTAPSLINQVSTMWSDVAQTSRHDSDRALLLAMALIAIHPFPDGNGRLARITYTWFTRRWGLEECWLAEDSTGEFLRTGFGRHSTEYLMSALILELCGGYNRNDFGYGAVHSEREDQMAARVLESQLQGLLQNDPAIFRSESFTLLRDHLQKEGHFSARYPRFEALREIIE